MNLVLKLLILFPVFAYSQTVPSNSNQVNVGNIFKIHSSVLEEDRELWIYTPGSFSPKSQNKYPVMYLLDGPSFFQSVTGMVQYLSSIGKMPEMIVVGIANTNRLRDLTPNHSIYWSDGEKDSASLHSSGGGEKFINFIEYDLFPFVDSVYKTTPYRMFVGHSLGGLTVLNTLINHTTLFTSYVAIDPSVWWNNHELIKTFSQQLPAKYLGNKSLYFASANTMSKNMDTSNVLIDTANKNIHVKDNLNFRKILEKDKNSQLKWSWKFYPEDNHISVPLIASYDALRFFFKGYELDKDLTDTSITISYIKIHYQKLSDLLQYQVLPSESIVNALGYIFLQRKSYNKALSFFKLNIENYPASANAYDSLGDYYLETNDKKKAMEYYRKSLQLKESSETRKKLKELEISK